MKSTYRDGSDAAHEVRLEVTGRRTAHVIVGDVDAALEITRLGPGRLRVRDGVRSFRVWVDRDGATRHVTIEGVGEALLEKQGRGSRRRREAPEGSLSSPMPGTVVKVLVAEGDAVLKGQDLLIVEAMKMEIKLSAPGAGRVRNVLTEEGARCDAGDTLVEVEAEEGP